MSYKVFIDGRAGTTGLKIEDFLACRDDIELIDIEDEKRKDVAERLHKMSEADISFLCLPDAESARIAAEAPADVRLIDASTYHRVDDAWVYGLPELVTGQRKKIAAASRVALPGCHATGFILLTRPLIGEGILGADYPFAFHSVTGYSGGGKKMIAQYEGHTGGHTGDGSFCVAPQHKKNRPRCVEPLKAPRQYALTQDHKHLPEMTKMAKLEAAPLFSPHVADFFSGLSVTLPLHGRLLLKGAGAADIRTIIEDRYRDEPFISVMPAGADPEDGYLSAGMMSGRNDVEIFIAGNAERVLLVARYDNLGKGASGAAIQCMNIMLGIPEERGLL